MRLRSLSKVKDLVSGRDGLKPGLSGFKSCVLLIEMATDSRMELHEVRLAGWMTELEGDTM